MSIIHHLWSWMILKHEQSGQLATNTKIVLIKIQRHATEDERRVSFHLSACCSGKKKMKRWSFKWPQLLVFINPVRQWGDWEEGRRGKNNDWMNFSRMKLLHSLEDCSVQFYCSVAWCGLLLLLSLARWIVALVVVPGVLVAVAAVLWLLEKNRDKQETGLKNLKLCFATLNQAGTSGAEKSRHLLSVHLKEHLGQVILSRL